MSAPAPMGPDQAEVVAHLAATQLFSQLSPATLARLAPAFERVDYGPGHVIAREGEADRALWVVTDGGLSVDRRADDGRLTHVGFLGYGAVVGARGVFVDAPRETSVVTVDTTALLRADGAELRARLRDDPDVRGKLVLPDDVHERLAQGEADRPLDGEVRVVVVRRHWLVLLRGLLAPALLFLVSLAAAVFVAPLAPSTAFALVLAVVALGIPAAGAIWAYYDYWYDTLIVTNRRIIHIERTPLVDTRRGEAQLERVQDVRVVTPSLLARVLGYGTISIQTAASRGLIELTFVPKPEALRATIFEQVDRARETARRGRDDWMLSHVRRALGVREPEAQGGVADEAGAAGVAGPLVLRWLARLALHFLPKMRVVEDGVITWRKHWWVLLRHTWFLLLPLAVVTLALPTVFLEATAVPWPWAVTAWVILFVALLWQYEDWRNDLYQLTDEHIIDIERLPLGFFEDRRQASLAQVQDIRFVVPNVVATLLNFGSVKIETAAESGDFSFDDVYNPAGVQEEIATRMDRLRSGASQAEADRRAEEIARWLAAYHRVAGEGHPSRPAAEPPA